MKDSGCDTLKVEIHIPWRLSGNMPNEISQIAQEDYLELEIAHNDQPGEINDVSLEDEFGNARLKEIIKNIDTNKRKRPGIRRFMAEVELDMGRSKPIGLKELFLVWLEQGNNYWLNPMDKQNGLG